MDILVVDIGNGSAKAARMRDREVVGSITVPTTGLFVPQADLYCWLRDGAEDGIRTVAYCSVVPGLSTVFEAQVVAMGLTVFNLNPATARDLRIDYPRPEEIGQDRLANALAGKALHGYPLVVIDFGTAVTFDVVGTGGAYEGGVIVPGLNLMVDYLHEKTALLPAVDVEDRSKVCVIGKSTVEAIRAGYTFGFEGMINGILETVRREIRRDGSGDPAVITTGGSVRWLQETGIARYPNEPNLTLIGLALAVESGDRGSG